MAHRYGGLAASITAGIAVLLLAPAAVATNGYFPHGYGAVSRGMAGTGVAWSQDATAGAVNPAGFVELGNRFDIGLEAFSPRRSYEIIGGPSFDPASTRVPGLIFPLAPGRVESGKEVFPIPSFGWSRQLGADDAIGLSIYANGGMNTTWPGFESPTCPPGSPGGTYCAGPAGVDLAQLFISPVYARRITPRLSIGVAPILAAQRFEATGIGSFAPLSSDPGNLSDAGHDTSFGYGVRLGVQGITDAGLRWGFAWRSRVRMGEFDDYRGLFADAGDFDVPESFVAGIAWQPTDRHTIALDIEHVRYSDIASVGLPFLPNLTRAPLGAAGAAGFGWEDVTTIKLGYQHVVDDRWRWRAGISKAEQPIPESEVLFNILAPGVQEWHVTGGATYTLAGGSEVTVSLMYSPEKTVRGQNPFNTNQTIALSMHQWALEVSWAFRGRR